MQNQDQPGEQFDETPIITRSSRNGTEDETLEFSQSEPSFASPAGQEEQNPYSVETELEAAQRKVRQPVQPVAESALFIRRHPVMTASLVVLAIAILALPLYFIAFGQKILPQQTPTDLLHSIMSGTPAYADPLTNAENQKTVYAHWVQYSPNNCFFASDGYHLQATGYSGCWESGYQFENLALSVDMTLLSGNSGGVYCRFGTGWFGSYYGYLLGIDGAGNYWISGSETVSQQPRFSPAIKQGYHVKNTLEMIVQDNTFYFFVNDVFLTKLVNTNPTPSATSPGAPSASPVPTPPPPQPYSGEIAFLANPAGTEAVFSNLEVYTLQ